MKYWDESDKPDYSPTDPIKKKRFSDSILENYREHMNESKEFESFLNNQKSWLEKLKTDPEKYNKYREYKREYDREYYGRSKEKCLEYRKTFIAKLKKDPVRYIEFIEKKKGIVRYI